MLRELKIKKVRLCICVSYQTNRRVALSAFNENRHYVNLLHKLIRKFKIFEGNIFNIEEIVLRYLVNLLEMN